MEYEVLQLRGADSLIQSHSDLSRMWKETSEAISAVVAVNVKRYFTDFNIGRKHAGLSTTISKLLILELEERGWSENFRFAPDDATLNSSLFGFDAVRSREGAGVCSLEISFDNRQKIGTNLLKPEVARLAGKGPLIHLPHIDFHIQITATAEFKKVAGIDPSCGSYEEYVTANEFFGPILTVPTVLVGLNGVRGIRVTQRRGANSRKSSQVFIEE